MTNEPFQIIAEAENGEIICYAKLKNCYVSVKGSSFGSFTLKQKQWNTVTTLPQKYRPSGTFYFSAQNPGGPILIHGSIDGSGVVSLYPMETTAYWVFSLTFSID